MNEQEMIGTALEVANLVEQLPEIYRADAFRVLLEHRLKGSPVATMSSQAQQAQSVSELLSFSEYLNSLVGLKNNPQFFTAVASFRERCHGEVSVTQDDIVNTMHGAGLRPPANFNRDMRVATSTKSALLMAAGTKDGKPSWQLTRTGKSFIEQNKKG